MPCTYILWCSILFLMKCWSLTSIATTFFWNLSRSSNHWFLFLIFFLTQEPSRARSLPQYTHGYNCACSFVNCNGGKLFSPQHSTRQWQVFDIYQKQKSSCCVVSSCFLPIETRALEGITQLNEETFKFFVEQMCWKQTCSKAPTCILQESGSKLNFFSFQSTPGTINQHWSH